MAFSTFDIRIIVIVLIAGSCSVAPAPQHGGGINTKDYLRLARSISFLKGLLSSVRSPHANENLLENSDKIRSMTTQDGFIRSDVIDNKSLLNVDDNADTSGIKYPSSLVSDIDRVNPFLRTRRDVCSIPVNIGQTISQLQSRLNETLYVGLNQQQSSTEIPPNQPEGCPNASYKWWPRKEHNLKAACPWKYVQKDLGVNAFPRYIPEAQCMCLSCINSPSMGCQSLTHNVTYFEFIGCQNKLALMNKKTVEVAVGCYCVSAIKQIKITGQVTVANEPPNDD